MRDRVAKVLMVLAALGALASFVGAIGAVAKAGPDTVVVESWRMLGFLVFAGIFALLAFRPRTLPGHVLARGYRAWREPSAVASSRL